MPSTSSCCSGTTAGTWGGADSSGYYNLARLLADGRLVESAPRFPGATPEERTWFFLPLGFVPAPEPGTMASYYPPGVPLLMLVAALLSGWSIGPFLLGPLAALVSVLAVRSLGRALGLAPAYATAAAAALALSPAFLFAALQPMSDVPATALCAVAALAAVRARQRPGWGWAVGAALAFAVAVRPANALMGLPLLLLLPPTPRIYGRAALAGLPLAALLMTYNRQALGGLFASGYGPDLGSDFALGFLASRLSHHVGWLAATMTPLVPLLWLGTAGARPLARRDRVALLVWFGAFLLLYGTYRYYDAWWYLRFLLPALPALLIGAAATTQGMVARLPRGAAVTAAAMLGVAVTVTAFHQSGELGALAIGGREATYRGATEMLARRLPADSYVVSRQLSGALHAYTPLTPARWDHINPSQLQELRRRSEPLGRRWYAAVFVSEQEEFLERLPADWRPFGTYRDVRFYRLPRAFRRPASRRGGASEPDR